MVPTGRKLNAGSGGNSEGSGEGDCEGVFSWQKVLHFAYFEGHSFGNGYPGPVTLQES
jgi:hypothetical protein